jgi:hypothetical protein
MAPHVHNHLFMRLGQVERSSNKIRREMPPLAPGRASSIETYGIGRPQTEVARCRSVRCRGRLNPPGVKRRMGNLNLLPWGRRLLHHRHRLMLAHLV